ALLGLLHFVLPGYYLFLFGLFIVLAPPWPSKGRTRLELRGYALSIACAHWKYPNLRSSKEWREIMLARYYETFTGWGYWRMSWNKEYIDEELGKIVEMILEDRLGEIIPISDEIRRIYKDQNV
ncbi:hypothetical protein KAU11_06970, partial [Candidatus Babeliales bacterium]|nr:hypothetical protein [Candidatus Babeliales bacterium]